MIVFLVLLFVRCCCCLLLHLLLQEKVDAADRRSYGGMLALEF